MASLTQHRYPPAIWALFISLLLLLTVIAGLLIYLLMQDSRYAFEAYDTGRFVKINVATGEMQGKVLQSKNAPSSRDSYKQKRIAEVAGVSAEEAAKAAAEPATPRDLAVPEAQPLEPKPVATAPVRAVPTASSGGDMLAAAKAVMRNPDQPLTLEPNLALLETLPGGMSLPKIAEDGTMPWRYYAKPSESVPSGNSMLSLVITNLGFNEARTNQALSLDERVTLAFSPYPKYREMHIEKARRAGFESWLLMPMQHENYPIHDYGPLTLLSDDSTTDNQEKLHALLKHSQGVVGLLATPKERFSRTKNMLSIYEELMQRGMLFALYDQQFTPKEGKERMIALRPHIHSGNVASSSEELFRSIESYVNSNGKAVFTLSAMPAMMADMNRWIATLEQKKISLVPLSAFAKAQQ